MHGYPRKKIFFSLEIVYSFQHHRPSWWTREREQKGGCFVFLKLEPVKTSHPAGLCSRVALSVLPPSPPLWREGAAVLCSLSYSLQLSEQKLRLLLRSCSCLPEGCPWGRGLKSSPLPPPSSSHLRSRAPQFWCPPLWGSGPQYVKLRSVPALLLDWPSMRPGDMWAPTLGRGGCPGIGSEPPPPGSLPGSPRPLLSSSKQLALCIHQKGFPGSFHVWAQAAWSPSLGSLWPWSRGQPGSLTWPACPITPSAVRGMGREQALDLALLQSASVQKLGCKKRHPLNPAEARSRCM